MKRWITRSVLADVNVWLATIVDAHPHHESAARWWSNDVVPSDVVVSFCRVTQLGLLRLLTNERVMGKQRRSVKAAWEDYQQLVGQRPVSYSNEPPGIEAVLHELFDGKRSSRNFWTDAYLAAFARAGAMELATFDRGFRRFTGVKLILL